MLGFLQVSPVAPGHPLKVQLLLHFLLLVKKTGKAYPGIRARQVKGNRSIVEKLSRGISVANIPSQSRKHTPGKHNHTVRQGGRDSGIQSIL